MKIYTSYFAKLSKLPANVIPISICGKAPAWYTGLQYKTLAPKYGFFMEWKQNQDNDFYIKNFKSQVLDHLKAREIVEQLKLMSNGFDVALICYEKPTDFCHRHLVADWLKENGYECEELSV